MFEKRPLISKIQQLPFIFQSSFTHKFFFHYSGSMVLFGTRGSPFELTFGTLRCFLHLVYNLTRDFFLQLVNAYSHSGSLHQVSLKCTLLTHHRLTHFWCLSTGYLRTNCKKKSRGPKLTNTLDRSEPTMCCCSRLRCRSVDWRVSDSIASRYIHQSFALWHISKTITRYPVFTCG